MHKTYLFCWSLLLLAFTSYGQNSTVAYIDADAIIKKMPAYKQIQKTLEIYQAQQLKMLDKETEETASFYMQTMEQIKGGALSYNQKKEAEAKLQEMQEELDLLKLQIDRGLIKRERELTKPMYDEFRQALAKVAQAQNYHYIIDKKFVLGLGEGLDASNKVKSVLGIK